MATITTDRKYPATYNFIAGGVSGAGSRVFTAPLDLIRIRRQLTVTYPQESLMQTWSNIVKHEGGILALFRGNSAAILLWISYTGVQFTVRDQVKLRLQISASSSYIPMLNFPAVVSFVAGASAGVCATLATYPFDVCRTAFAAKGLTSTPSPQSPPSTPLPFSSLVEPTYRNLNHNLPRENAPPRTLLEFASQLFRQKGIRGFYAGASSAVVQIIPYMGLTFTIYDWLTDNDRRVMLSAYAGSISGAVSKILVFPLDTVKRRLQAQAFYESSNRYRGMIHCFKRIYRDEGIGGFYRGMVPSVLKTTLATCLSFAIFRSTKNILEHLHDQHFEDE